MPSLALIGASELLERTGGITDRFPHGLVSDWPPGANVRWVL